MRFSLVLLALVFMLGCSGNSAGISIDSSNQNVVLSDPTLAKNLKFGNAKTRKVNDRLQANVLLTNTTTNTLKLQYRFYWYDELGLELNLEQSPWKSIILYGGDTLSLQGVAINPLAENFRVSIRDIK